MAANARRVTTLPLTSFPINPVVRLTVRNRLVVAMAAAIMLSALAGAILIDATGMSIEFAGFARFLGLAAIMGALAWWCAKRGLDARLGAAAGIVGTAIVALLVCAVVSNIGLRLGVPLADDRFQTLDAAAGIKADAVIRAVASQPLLTGLLSMLYNTSQIAVAVLIGIAVARKQISQAWELTATAVIAMQAVALASPAFPAWGAMKQFALEGLQGHGLPIGAGVYQWPAFAHFYQGSDPVLRLADLGGVVAFPSFHTVLALMITQALAETRLRWLGIAWTAGIMLSAIPMGGHYAVDLAGGFLIWLAAAGLSRKLSSPSA